jgi:ornithine--oxo-acid transaminase
VTKSREIIDLTEQHGARNYHPLPVVIAKAEGVWVEDSEGNRYMDMLSSYSALNQGHRHPKIIQALKDQSDRVTVTSRAFHNDRLGPFYAKLAEITGKRKILPMNTGTEAVETAIKAARRWAYKVKKVQPGKAEIIVCEGNFHGRTVTVIGFSSEQDYRSDFGPFTPGFKIIPYGDLKALEDAICENTAAFLVEPIQGEAGVRVPPDGYVREAYRLCREKNVLFMADEIQTGLGRTGKMFCCDWESVVPDVYILGKALGGGVIPVSAIAANEDVMDVFEPGSHGSTFGGNPLGAAVATAALQVIQDENLPDNAAKMGKILMDHLKRIQNPHIQEIRGKGLFVGMVLDTNARPYCERLMEKGILAKETHAEIVRFAPPLVIKESEVLWACERIREVMEPASGEEKAADGALQS